METSFILFEWTLAVIVAYMNIWVPLIHVIILEAAQTFVAEDYLVIIEIHLKTTFLPLIQSNLLCFCLMITLWLFRWLGLSLIIICIINSSCKWLSITTLLGKEGSLLSFALHELLLNILENVFILLQTHSASNLFLI